MVSLIWLLSVVSMQLKVQMTDKPNSTVNFRKLLLNRCQKEFEKDKADDVVFERKQKELDSAALVCLLISIFYSASSYWSWCLSFSASGNRARAASGGAGGSQRQGQAALHWQHQVHRRALQAQDADRSNHAWLRGQATEEPWRGVFRVPVQAAYHHWEGPGLWKGQGEQQEV